MKVKKGEVLYNLRTHKLYTVIAIKKDGTVELERQGGLRFEQAASGINEKTYTKKVPKRDSALDYIR